MAAPRSSPLSAAGRVFAWWFSGLTAARSWFPGVRLLLAGVAVGAVLGWSGGRLLRVLVVEETSLPRPVTSPGPGAAWVHVLTTGYCPCALCCGPFANGHTAINRDVAVFPFGIAVAPTLIPYREVIEVPGYGTAMVDDTGSAMRHDADQRHIVHLDLRFTSHAEARRWGRRWMWVSLPSDGNAARLEPVPH